MVSSRFGTAALMAFWVLVMTVAGNFMQDFDLSWGDNRAKILGGGNLLSLSLDRASGSGFKSKTQYLFGRIDMQLKLVPGNSAGTVTAYYLSSEGPAHDEIDFEFLGNLSGHPYTLHTNVYTQGQGQREQQFHLWFDPTRNFHTYSILWTSAKIILLVDNTPIRVFRNLESWGVPFPKNQPMRLYSSLWNADDWATQGGLVKTDWSRAPFTAYYRNYNFNALHASSSPGSASGRQAASLDGGSAEQELDDRQLRRLRWVRRKFMVYDYCTDKKRFPQGAPSECRQSSRRDP